MKTHVLISLFLAPFFAVAAPAADNVPNHLQEISITLQTGNGSGSGVIFTRKDAAGELVNFVWTAGHVIASMRTEREVISPDGNKRTVVEFNDAKIVKELHENSRTVGRTEMDAEVLKYSNADTGEDVALLRLRKRNFVTDSVVFYLDSAVPPIGTELYHVGSLLGQRGANSMTTGIVSQQGRVFEKKIYDQTTVTAFPGSSGGGVFLRDGRYCAMLVRGSGEQFNLVVPIRRIREFAEKVKILWALDPKVPLPSDAEILLIPIEDTPKFQIQAKAP